MNFSATTPVPPVRVGCGSVGESAAMSPTTSGRLVRFAQVGRTGRGMSAHAQHLGALDAPRIGRPLCSGSPAVADRVLASHRWGRPAPPLLFCAEGMIAGVAPGVD